MQLYSSGFQISISLISGSSHPFGHLMHGLDSILVLLASVINVVVIFIVLLYYKHYITCQLYV